MSKLTILVALGLLAGQASAFSVIGNDWSYLAAPRTVEYTVNDASVPGANSVLVAASDTWSAIDFNCFTYNLNGSNTDTVLDDLTVDPADGNDIFAAGTDPTALAVTQSWHYTATPTEMIEWNMQIFTNYTWHTGAGVAPSGSYDLQSVVLHELGHALGLGHSGTSSAVMFATLPDGVNKRVLQPDDLDGFEFIYDCVPNGNCETIAYHTAQGGATFYATFPIIGANTFRKVAYYIDPPADGTVEAMRLQYYNANVTPANGGPLPHNGTLRVTIHADNAGLPGAQTYGPFDYSTNGFAATFGSWDEVDLSSHGITFSALVPYHVVWEFIPTTEGTDQLAPLGTTFAAGASGNQMYNETTAAWNWWFTGRGDLLQQVDVCYTETPPGNLVLSESIVDLGRIEIGSELSTTVDVQNTGFQDLTINSISLSNGVHFSASMAGLPLVLAPNATSSFTVTYNSPVAVFRDTTTVSVNWGAHSSEMFILAGSSECNLSNDWVGQPDEQDWFVSQAGDTNILGGSWFLFGDSFNRPGNFLGHPYTAENDTAFSELYTFLDNAEFDNISWRFAQTQQFAEDTQDHELLVYSVQNDTLNFLTGFDISDTLFWQSSPTWSHITASLDSLPDSLAFSFLYAGTFADSWYIDDVEFCRTNGPCYPISIDIAKLAGNNVQVSWTPYATTDDVVNIWESTNAYDFTSATLVAIVPMANGQISLPAASPKKFYVATVDCHPTMEASSSSLPRIERHPLGKDRIPMSSLRRVPVIAPEQASRQGLLPQVVEAREMSRTR
ncbi:MAG: matrixin family metalloprotease [Calditrichaeota bacterium]|nr:matrixin family metalloprotease [Calditrichota bacterium]